MCLNAQPPGAQLRRRVSPVSTAKYQSLLSPTLKVTEEQYETDRNLLAFERSIQHLTRRGFVTGAAGAAALATFAGGSRAEAQAAAPAISDVLNFALNLEYLEANLYQFAATGSPLTSAQNNGGVAPEGLPTTPLTLDSNTLAVYKALAQDEINHINDLTSALKSMSVTPVAQPLINYAALGMITTQAQLIATTRQFTAVGNSAYAGAAQYLVSNEMVLATAASILGAEGQHLGAVNNLCVIQGVTSPQVDSLDVPPSSTNYFTVSAMTALGPSRTTSQVLGIVYGVTTASTSATPAAGTMSGGFFPSGVAGNIKST